MTDLEIVEARKQARDLVCEAYVEHPVWRTARCLKPVTYVANSRKGNGQPIWPVVCDSCAQRYVERGFTLTPIKEAEQMSLYGTGSFYGWMQADRKWRIEC